MSGAANPGVFFARPEILDIEGVRVTVAPVKIKHLPALLDAGLPLLAAVRSGDGIDLLKLAAKADVLADLCALACEFDMGDTALSPRDWLDGLNPAQLARIFLAWFEVNRVFLQGEMLPLILNLNRAGSKPHLSETAGSGDSQASDPRGDSQKQDPPLTKGGRGGSQASTA
jgi:hypothetical protein